MRPLVYNIDKTLDYLNELKKHRKAIEDYTGIVEHKNIKLTGTLDKLVYNNDITINPYDKDCLAKMAKKIINSVNQDENNYDLVNVEIDYDKGMVLFKPKRSYRLTITSIPKYKYYGRKRNKMINTYHKY